MEFVKVQDWLSGTELSGLNFSIYSNLHKKTDLGRLKPMKNNKNCILPDTAVFNLLKNVLIMHTDFLSLPKFSKTPASGP